MESAYGSVRAANISSVLACRSACSLRAYVVSPARASLPSFGGASSPSPAPDRSSAATATGSLVGSAKYAPVARPSRIVSICAFALSAVAAMLRSGRSEASLLMPTSAPSRLKTGPPESPGLSGASIANRQPSRPITRPNRNGGGRHGDRSGPSG